MKFVGSFTTDGLRFSSYTRGKLREYAKEHLNGKFEIIPVLPESKKQRGWFEGAVVPLLTFYQEGMDYRNSDDRRKVREWIKQEFHSEFVTIAGKAQRVTKSTKGELATGFLGRVVEWLEENYAPPREALDPERYQVWRDTVYSFGGPDTYIGYLQEIGLIR